MFFFIFMSTVINTTEKIISYINRLIFFRSWRKAFPSGSALLQGRSHVHLTIFSFNYRFHFSVLFIYVCLLFFIAGYLYYLMYGDLHK